MRYHYLRALYHETLPMLEQAGFTYDTTLAFAEHEGFRCGCSFPFRPYSLAEERPLDLVELPLAVMDGTLQEPHYRGLAAKDAEFAAASVLARALRSGGAVSLLWHNNRFDRRVSRGYDKVYWRLLDQALASRRLVHERGRRRRALEGGDGVTRVLHLSVVHKPDDPRIYERECRTLAGAGYEVMYMVPGAQPGRDDAGVILAPLPERGRSTRFLSSVEITKALRALKPDVLHVHDPELLTLFPAARAIVPKLVYDMHEYVPEAVAGKPYIPAKVRPVASQTTAVAQKSLAALGSGVVVVTEDQLEALGRTPGLRLVLPNYPRVERFEGAEPVPELAADPRLKLIYVGSLSRARGCTMMLDVMEQLEPRRGRAVPRRHLQRPGARDGGRRAPGRRPRRPRQAARPHPAAGAAALPGGGRRRLGAVAAGPPVQPPDDPDQAPRGHDDGARRAGQQHAGARRARPPRGVRARRRAGRRRPPAGTPASADESFRARRRWALAAAARSSAATAGRPSRAIW